MTLLGRILLLVSLAILPALGIQYYQRWELHKVAEAATREDALKTLALVEGDLQTMVEGARTTILVLSETNVVRRHDVEGCQERLERLDERYNFHNSVEFVISNRRGTVWCASHRTAVSVDVSEKPCVQRAMASGEFVTGEFSTCWVDSSPGLPFAVAYRNLDGSIGGGVSAIYRATTISRVITAESVPAGTTIAVLDHGGRILSATARWLQPGATLGQHERWVLAASKRGTFESRDPDGVNRLIAYSPPEASGICCLYLLVGRDHRTLIDGARFSAGVGLGLIALDLAVALGLATFAYGGLIRRPLASLTSTAREWREGNYAARPAAAPCPELRDLYASLAQMAQAVAHREQDHRARHEAEQAANHAKETLALAMNAASAGWWAWDIRNDVLTASQEAARLLGIAGPAGLGRLEDWLALVHAEDRGRLKAAVQHALASRQQLPRLEFRVGGPGEAERWLAAIGRITFDEGGLPVGYIGIHIDITEQKQLEAQLVTARKEAETANRHKTSFLSTASHDLRQPVQSLMLFSAILAARLRDPKDREIIARFDGAIKALKTLLDGLLDISRLESGSISPQIADQPLEPVFAQIAAEYQPRAAARGLRLRVVGTSLCVRTDAALLDRILRNLVENAVSYTRRGRILLGCRRRGDSVRIQILDTGIGIPKPELELIFREFHQVANPERSAAKGLGLGLAIVQKLSVLLGYRISVRSDVGRGTCFEVVIPRAPSPVLPPHGTATPEGLAPLQGCVALIEDDTAIREGLEHQLADWGMTVVAGADAAAVLWQLGGQRPDVILADYRLEEGRTGVDAVRQLNERLGASIPAILFTGETDPARIRLIQESGLPILFKPLMPADLRRAIKRYIPMVGRPGT